MMSQAVSSAGRSSIYGLFRAQVPRKPGAMAVKWADGAWSYEAFDERVRRLAAVFRSRGVGRGDRVAILSENRADYVTSVIACALTGAILACQNWRLQAEELTHCIQLVGPKLLVVSERNRSRLDELAVDAIPVLDLDDGFEALLRTAVPVAPESEAEPEDGIVILYTSGTTGLPKGALISHRAEIARMCALRLDCNARESDDFAAWAPLFHMASMDQTLGSLISGATVIVIDGLKPDEIGRAACEHDLSWLVMMPGAIEPMIEWLRANRPAVRRIACVGAMADLVPRAQLAELTNLFGAPYLNSFGATETGLPPASAAMIAPGDSAYSLSKRPSSLCEIRLVDPEGRDVPDGEPGELAIRGPTVFSGYWDAAEANERDFRDGWFRMGDLFRRNPDGTLDFVDRAKYMIKTGGENVYPAEIERVLLADPRVADAVVVRKSDPQWGEVPVAFVARRDPSLSSDDIEVLCRARLAGYKRPREVRFISEAELPRSTTGKIQRHEIEQWLK